MTTKWYLDNIYPDKAKQYQELFEATPTKYKPIVTLSDVQDKYIERYFVQLVTDTDYIVEVDAKNYEKFKLNPRFLTIKIKWKIVGVRETIERNGGVMEWGVEDINREIIRVADLTMIGLKKYITDYTEFWQAER